MKVPQKRKEAKENGFIYYFTGKPCIHGHISLRFSNTGNCVECYRNRYQGVKKRVVEELAVRKPAIVRRKQKLRPECQAFIEKWLETHKAK